MRITNLTSGVCLAQNAAVADSLFSRMKGLLGKESLSYGQALILQPCNSVHTFFMKFSLDLIFVNKENRIIKIIANLKPWRLSGVYLQAAYVIEFPAGSLVSSESKEGDTILIS
ncbi:MAG: DUF192 domain-containing protein [Candidatus Omnitrophica bacterium]|jgi:hypothetical protein|nr:DUF192 domain-containing protein [Candidatus Omnitrophota bacterium]